MEPRLKSIYKTEILPQLKDSLGVQNVMEVPKLVKIVINMGLGLDANDNKILKIWPHKATDKCLHLFAILWK